MQLIDHTGHHNQDTMHTPKTGVILHHTVTASTSRSEAMELAHIDSIARWHLTTNSWKKWKFDFGYHYIIFPSGRTYHVGKDETVRAHTGGVDEKGRRYNELYIGVALVGNFVTTEPNQATQEAAQNLLDHLRLPLVGGHKDMLNQATTCPGNWDYKRSLGTKAWSVKNPDDWTRLLKALTTGNMRLTTIGQSYELHEIRMRPRR